MYQQININFWVYMRTVLLLQDANPTSVNKCVNTLIYSMCMCTLLLSKDIETNAVNEFINTLTYGVCIFVYCVTAAV